MKPLGELRENAERLKTEKLKLEDDGIEVGIRAATSVLRVVDGTSGTEADEQIVLLADGGLMKNSDRDSRAAAP